MAEDEKSGQQVESPDKPDNEEAQPAQEGDAQESQLQIPEKFRGKSLKDVVRAYQEVETEKGRLASEVGKLREGVSYYEQYLQNLAGQMQQNQAKPDASQDRDTDTDENDFFSNPEKIIKRVIDEKFGEYEKVQRGRRESDLFEQGFKQAVAENPELFNGIENEVRNTVKNYYQGVKQANPYVDERILSDPNTWRTAGMTFHIAQGNYSKVVPKDFKIPISAPQGGMGTETPGGGSQETESTPSVNFDESARAFLGKAKVSEKKAAELMKKYRDSGDLR
jgi:hypothetical protein